MPSVEQQYVCSTCCTFRRQAAVKQAFRHPGSSRQCLNMMSVCALATHQPIPCLETCWENLGSLCVACLLAINRLSNIGCVCCTAGVIQHGLSMFELPFLSAGGFSVSILLGLCCSCSVVPSSCRRQATAGPSLASCNLTYTLVVAKQHVSYPAARCCTAVAPFAGACHDVERGTHLDADGFPPSWHLSIQGAGLLVHVMFLRASLCHLPCLPGTVVSACH
jgi:hypothetical protein